MKSRSLPTKSAKARTNVGEGLRHLVQSGMSMQQAMSFLPLMAQHAKVADADMGDLADTIASLQRNLKIETVEGMNKALLGFSEASKMGAFEAKDYARHIPTLTGQMARIGWVGTEGANRIAAIMQVVRDQAPTAENAVTGVVDLLSRIRNPHFEEFAREFNVDLKKMMNDAQRAGKEPLQAFVSGIDLVLTRMAKAEGIAEKDKGVLLDKIFPEKDLRTAFSAIAGNIDRLNAVFYAASRGDMVAFQKALKALTEDAQSDITRLGNAAEKLKNQVGKSLIDLGAIEGLNYLTIGVRRATGAVTDLGTAFQNAKRASVPRTCRLSF